MIKLGTPDDLQPRACVILTAKAASEAYSLFFSKRSTDCKVLLKHLREMGVHDLPKSKPHKVLNLHAKVSKILDRKQSQLFKTLIGGDSQSKDVDVLKGAAAAVRAVKNAGDAAIHAIDDQHGEMIGSTMRCLDQTVIAAEVKYIHKYQFTAKQRINDILRGLVLDLQRENFPSRKVRNLYRTPVLEKVVEYSESEIASHNEETVFLELGAALNRKASELARLQRLRKGALKIREQVAPSMLSEVDSNFSHQTDESEYSGLWFDLTGLSGASSENLSNCDMDDDIAPSQLLSFAEMVEGYISLASEIVAEKASAEIDTIEI